MNKISVAACSAILIACSVLPVHAHHSFSTYNMTKDVALTGVIKEFQWTNPHSWIQIVVPGKKGTVEWSLEMSSTINLLRGGWRPKTVKPGDKVTITVHPRRDGKPGGSVMHAILADGRTIGMVGNAAGNASQ